MRVGRSEALVPIASIVDSFWTIFLVTINFSMTDVASVRLAKVDESLMRETTQCKHPLNPTERQRIHHK